MTAIRKEVMSCIADLPDNKLKALMPILTVLVEDTVILETDLTEDEKGIIRQGRKDYEQGEFVAMLLN